MRVYMFHYVTKEFNYYHFDVDLFEKTLIQLKKDYSIISLKEFDHIYNNGREQNYVLLTFDDATIDHYQKVYPILLKHNCSGLFFVSSCNFTNKILDIQIIHQLLALNKFDEIYNDLMSELKKNGDKINERILFNALDNEKEKIFKQILQYKLPYLIRKKILNKLILKYNISTKNNDYYISVNNLKEMKKNGMYFGIHTSNHPNLKLLNYKQQYKEINDNLLLLLKNKLAENDLLSIAYPFGLYNEDTFKVLKELNIKYGFKAFNSAIENKFEINRIDCNELK